MINKFIYYFKMYSGLEYYKSEINLFDLLCERIFDKYMETCHDKVLCYTCTNDKLNNEQIKKDIEWKLLCQKCKNIMMEWFKENNFYINLAYSGLVGEYDSEVEHHQRELSKSELITNDLLYDNVIFDRLVKDVFEIDIQIYSYNEETIHDDQHSISEEDIISNDFNIDPKSLAYYNANIEKIKKQCEYLFDFLEK